eukprot:gene12729-13941_t
MAEEAPRTNFMEDIARKYQYVLDKSSPHVLYRWILFVLCLSIYLFDPEESDLDGGLPTKESDEYRPFARRLPEFKFWHSSVRSVIISFFMTFFEVFDVPVFWPILLLYFIVLFFITMKRQIKHMVKYRYIPFSWGKKKYEGKAPAKDSK